MRKSRSKSKVGAVIMVIVLIVVALLIAGLCTGFFKKLSNKTCTVTFDLGAYDGEETIEPIKVKEGKEIELPEAPEWQEHTFTCWRIGDDMADAGDNYTVTKDVTALAVWEGIIPIVKYTVTFDLGDYDGEETVAPITVTQGSDFELPEAPEWEDHTFDGWRIGQDLKQPHTRFTPTETVTATAEWTEIVKYTVTFELGDYDGEETVNSVTVTQGSDFELPEAPTWEDHTFDGWRIGQELKQPHTRFTPTETVTATAEWTEIVKYTVTFDLGAYDGEETVAPITVRQGEGIDLPTPPTWTGYTFHGWKVGNIYKQAGEHVDISSSVRYTAKWTKNDLLDGRTWYALGAGNGTLRTNAWTHNKLIMERDNSEDADNLFTIELTLYAGDQFKITYNTDWTVAFGRNDIWSGWEHFEDDDGGDHNITLKADEDGVYKIKLYTFMMSDGETSHLDITKVRSISPYAGDKGEEGPSAVAIFKIRDVADGQSKREAYE